MISEERERTRIMRTLTLDTLMANPVDVLEELLNQYGSEEPMS